MSTLIEINKLSKVYKRDKHEIRPLNEISLTINRGDFLALVGDTADGYPGIEGIGRVGAARLIAKHGALEDFPDNELLRIEAVGDRTGATVIVVGHLDEEGSGRLLDAIERVLATRPRAIAIA